MGTTNKMKFDFDFNFEVENKQKTWSSVCAI